MNVYYCGLCGFAVIACGVKLEKMSKRKLDQSMVVDLQELRTKEKDLVFKHFLLEGNDYYTKNRIK